ncbi:MAG: glycosyltransferase family 4 protein [Promethearchaeota archaeon]
MNNILLIPTRFFPAISGAEFYFQRIAENLKSKYNCNIDIITSNAIDFKALRDPDGKKITSSDKYYNQVNNLIVNRYITTYDFPVEEILKNLRSIPSLIKLNLSEAQLSKFIKNGPYLENLLNELLTKPDLNYDLIHTTFFPYFNCVISLIIGKLIKRPVICTPFFHFSNPRYSDHDLIDILKKFDLIIACTNLEKEFLVQECDIPTENITVIPMGVDYDKFRNFPKLKPHNSYFKQKFFRRNEKKYKLILFSGYKNYEKGAISILKSIPIILNKVKKVYFVFIGPPTIAFNRELSNILKLENVRIINFTPDNLTGYFDKKKIAAFKEADIYLMPSRSDAFGISYLEAWAAGKPVIGARIGATPEVIRENIDGLLVEFDDPKDIAEKVIFLLKNKKLRKKYGLTGEKRVRENYTWDQITKETYDAYENLLNNFK